MLVRLSLLSCCAVSLHTLFFFLHKSDSAFLVLHCCCILRFSAPRVPPLSALYPHPTSLTPTPSPLSPHPSSLNPQPSTLNPQAPTRDAQAKSIDLDGRRINKKNKTIKHETASKPGRERDKNDACTVKVQKKHLATHPANQSKQSPN